MTWFVSLVSNFDNEWQLDEGLSRPNTVGNLVPEKFDLVSDYDFRLPR